VLEISQFRSSSAPDFAFGNAFTKILSLASQGFARFDKLVTTMMIEFCRFLETRGDEQANYDCRNMNEKAFPRMNRTAGVPRLAAC
jgi:hypothetical protein